MRQTLLASQKAAASSIALLLSFAAASAAPTAVTVNGWIRSHRQQAKVSFIDLNDGSDHTGLQAVISREVLNACEPETRDGLGTGASVSLRGELRKKRGGKDRDSLELSVDSVRLLGGCDGKVCSFSRCAGYPSLHRLASVIQQADASRHHALR
jgi:aspartyl/asparaginyl-tRNA synthetase